MDECLSIDLGQLIRGQRLRHEVGVGVHDGGEGPLLEDAFDDCGRDVRQRGQFCLRRGVQIDEALANLRGSGRDGEREAEGDQRNDRAESSTRHGGTPCLQLANDWPKADRRGDEMHT